MIKFQNKKSQSTEQSFWKHLIHLSLIKNKIAKITLKCISSFGRSVEQYKYVIFTL